MAKRVPADGGVGVWTRIDSLLRIKNVPKNSLAMVCDSLDRVEGEVEIHSFTKNVTAQSVKTNSTKLLLIRGKLRGSFQGKWLLLKVPL